LTLAKEQERLAPRLIKPQSPVRQSNFELLRILLMLMIVAYHLRGYGGFGSLPGATGSRVLLYLLTLGGKVGVDCFVLLSGYFMCTYTGGGLRPRRLLKLWMQLFFYSAGIYIAMGLAGISRFGAEGNFTYFLPVSRNVYWFGTRYFFLMLLSPFLNKLMQGMTRKEYRRLLAVCTVIVSVLPTLLRTGYAIPNMTLMLYLYLLAGYLRLHPEPLFQRKWLALGMAVGSYLFMVGYTLAHSWLLPRLPFLRFLPRQNFSPGNSIPALLCALGLFLFFRNLKVRGNRAVNLIASGAFGVYLLHDHSKPLREWLWLDIFDARPLLARPAALAWHIIWVVLAIFAIGILIDLFRQYVLEKPLFYLIDKTKFGKKYLHD